MGLVPISPSPHLRLREQANSDLLISAVNPATSGIVATASSLNRIASTPIVVTSKGVRDLTKGANVPK